MLNNRQGALLSMCHNWTVTLLHPIWYACKLNYSYCFCHDGLRVQSRYHILLLGRVRLFCLTILCLCLENRLPLPPPQKLTSLTIIVLMLLYDDISGRKFWFTWFLNAVVASPYLSMPGVLASSRFIDALVAWRKSALILLFKVRSIWLYEWTLHLSWRSYLLNSSLNWL